MIIAFIFTAHLIFAGYIFFKKKKTESIGSAIQNLILIIVLFSVGWSILTLVLQAFIEPEGFGEAFNRDTIVLTTLTIIEFFFYRMYYWKDTTEGGKETQ